MGMSGFCFKRKLNQTKDSIVEHVHIVGSNPFGYKGLTIEILNLLRSEKLHEDEVSI